MAEHEELLSEMELIERLPTQERLKQAKRRRALQLKRWQDNENDYPKKTTQQQQNNHMIMKANVKFQDHIMLLDAIMRKDYNEAQRLLELNVNPNLANEDGLTSIHQCCIDDSPDLLKLLIKYGANVNVCDNDLWTPLHAAATCANLEICKILIENNAELLAVNTDGNMPYDICDDEVCLEYIESEMANRGVTQQAIDVKRAEVEIKMLEDIKLHTNDLNKVFAEQNGATSIHIACANGYTSVLEYLLENKAALSVRDNDGWTPLHVATFWGHQKAIELLIEYGADIYAKTYNDETVFDLSDDIDVREFIVQKKKECENNEKSVRTRSLKRTSTGVSRSSSIRRSSFRDKEKCRKLDTSFKEVLMANENQREKLDTEEFIDKSIPSYENVNPNNTVNKQQQPQKQENLPNGHHHIKNHSQSLDNGKKVLQDSTNLSIKLNNNHNNSSSKLPNQITINEKTANQHIYINDDNNNLSLDLEKNRQVLPLKSMPKNTSISSSSNIDSSTSTFNNQSKTNSSNSTNNTNTTTNTSISSNLTNTTFTTNVNNNNNNSSNLNKINESCLSPPFMTEDVKTQAVTDLSSKKFSTKPPPPPSTTTQPPKPVTQNGGAVVITNQVTPTTHYVSQFEPNQNNYNSKIKFSDIKSKLDSYPATQTAMDTDGFKYKFKSDETIGGKTDLNSSDNSSKFNCSKCLNCSIM